MLILLPDLVVLHGLQHWACCVATMQLEGLQKTLGKLSVFGLRVCHLQNRCNLWANRSVLPPSLAAVLLIPFAEIFPAASYCFFSYLFLTANKPSKPTLHQGRHVTRQCITPNALQHLHQCYGQTTAGPGSFSPFCEAGWGLLCPDVPKIMKISLAGPRRKKTEKLCSEMFWINMDHETTIIKISWKSFAQQRRVVGPSKSKLINWWIMMITSRIAKLWISSASKYVSELSTSIYPSYLIMKIYHICPCLHKNSPKLSLLAQWWIWCKMESNLSHVQQKLKLPKTQPNRSNLAQFLSHSRAPTVFPLHEALFFQAVPDLGDGAVQ